MDLMSGVKSCGVESSMSCTSEAPALIPGQTADHGYRQASGLSIFADVAGIEL